MPRYEVREIQTLEVVYYVTAADEDHARGHVEMLGYNEYDDVLSYKPPNITSIKRIGDDDDHHN